MRLIAHQRYVLPLLGLATGMALYSHNLAFLTLGAANVFLLWRRDWSAQFRLIIAQIVGVFLFFPWLFYVPTQIAKIQRAFWTQPPGLADVLQMLVVFTTHLPLPPVVFALALFITLAIFALATLELVRAFRRGAPPALGLVLAFALVPPVLMFALSYVMRPIFVPRGVIVSSLAYYILLAYIVARAPRAVPLTIAVFIALLTLPFYYSAWGEWRRAPFAEANQFLRAHVQADDLILHDNKLSFFPMHFYDRTLPQQFLADPPGSSNDTLARGSQEALGLFPIDFDVAVRGRTRVWFVIFQTAIDEAAQEGRAHGNLSRLDALMRRGDVVAFGDVRIYRYEIR
jgi:mannosyltransferase